MLKLPPRLMLKKKLIKQPNSRPLRMLKSPQRSKLKNRRS
jgi:hypothetical protein